MNNRSTVLGLKSLYAIPMARGSCQGCLTLYVGGLSRRLRNGCSRVDWRR